MREELTLPNPGTLGDYNPSVSPDGSRIAFIRGINGATSDFLLTYPPAARPRVTWDNQDLVGVDWSADGRSLVYATDRAGGYTIWRAGIDGLRTATRRRRRRKVEASIGGAPERSSYESWSARSTVETPIADRLDLEDDLTPTRRPLCRPPIRGITCPTLAGTQNGLHPSTRSGGAELWISDPDGNNARQLTRFGRAYIRPRDGRQTAPGF